MISSAQARAARALLNIAQGEVAQGTGLNIATVSSIETGEKETQAGSLKKLQNWFETQNIEFFAGDGVRFRQALRLYEGADGFRSFMDDVYLAASTGYGDICIFNGLPAKMVEVLGKDFYTAHADRMKEIRKRFTLKVIIREGDTSYIGASFAEYRWWPADRFRETMIYVYEDRVAHINFKDGVRALVVQDRNTADSMRDLFGWAWEKAEAPGDG